MNKATIAKRGQEQAIGAWMDYLNQVRLNELIETLAEQKENFQEAIKTLDLTLEQVHDLIRSNRGGVKGMHGFIAEIAECGLGNAYKQVAGENTVYEWINDNGPADLLRNGIEIQQKFVQFGGKFSLQAVAEHLRKYPDFLKNGGKYQIPSDHYEKIQTLLAMSEKEANRLPSNSDLTLKDWKFVHSFFKENSIEVEDLEGSRLSYRAVQVNQIDGTLAQERTKIQKIDEERKTFAFQKSKPSLQEGAKTAAWSAVIEGGTTLAINIRKKRKEGKALKDFTENDWEEIAKDSGLGTLKGGVRGVSIYMFTNYTATPGVVASAVVTASFQMAEQAHLFRIGKLSEMELIENAECAALDAAVSALSSLIGQVIIPIPVLNAVIGNSVGMIMYQIAKDNLSKKEQNLMRNYIKNQRILDKELKKEYAKYLESLSESLQRYMELLEQAFSSDIEEAFVGSIKLCKEAGVPLEEILDTKEKVDRYFWD